MKRTKCSLRVAIPVETQAAIQAAAKQADLSVPVMAGQLLDAAFSGTKNEASNLYYIYTPDEVVEIKKLLLGIKRLMPTSCGEDAQPGAYISIISHLKTIESKLEK